MNPSTLRFSYGAFHYAQVNYRNQGFCLVGLNELGSDRTILGKKGEMGNAEFRGSCISSALICFFPNSSSGGETRVGTGGRTILDRLKCTGRVALVSIFGDHWSYAAGALIFNRSTGVPDTP
jgi:hypothetical protein